jgi:hypothetical protein
MAWGDADGWMSNFKRHMRHDEHRMSANSTPAKAVFRAAFGRNALLPPRGYVVPDSSIWSAIISPARDRLHPFGVAIIYHIYIPRLRWGHTPRHDARHGHQKLAAIHHPRHEEIKRK